MGRGLKFDISNNHKTAEKAVYLWNNALIMGNWKIIRTKEYEALQTELKGYYEMTEQENLYLDALERQLRGSLRLPSVTNITREGIRNAYETSAPVYGVINYIAENVGDVANYLELTKNGEVVENHWLLNTLRRPNDRFTLRKFVISWAINKLLFGDAWVYAPIRMGKDGGRSLYVIPSHKVAVKNGNPLFEGIHLVGIQGKDIDASQVFESFDYNLDDTSLFGTSKVAAAAYYLSVMEKGIQRQDKTLEEGGATHLITPKPDATGSVMPKDAHEIEKLANGKGSIGKRRALQFPVEVHQLGSTPVDLSILESHKEAVTALCFVFRLPVDLYYGQAKYENAKEAKKTIFEQNAIPLANEFAEDLLHYLKLDIEGYELKVNTDRIDVLKESTGEVLDNLNKMHATLNELREAYGYERIEEGWADKPILPLGVSFGNEYEDINEDGI